MKLGRERRLIVFVCLLGAAITGVAYGQESEEKTNATAGKLPSGENREMLDLMHRTRELVEQSQVELRRSRERSERLQQMLDETRQDLARLREEMDQLRASMVSSPSAAQPAVPGTSKERKNAGELSDAATRDDADLATRLTRVEDQVELNAVQIREHAQTKVESESRFKVRLFGTILNNTYFNSSDSSQEAVPTAAPPPGQSVGRNLGATLRQTQIGFSMTGPKLGEARLSADIDFDFFGGVGSAYERNVLGALRMRTASVRFDGLKTSLAMGLMTPMISPRNPASLAEVYYPALGESGNLWQWLPQVMVERRTPFHQSSDLLLQAGLILPFGETVNGTGLAGRPGYESRIAYSRKVDDDAPLEIGVGGYFHPWSFGFRRTVDSYAVTGDWLIPLARRLELSGEAFYGRSISLGKQSGEDIADLFSFSGSLQNPLTAVRGNHSTGGWAQLRAKVTAKFDLNAAFGLDDPRNRDIIAGQSYAYNDVRLKNQTFSINSIYRFRSNFLVSAEYRRLWTRYRATQTSNNHVNLAIGYNF
jgi:hypothetical protein